MMPRIRSIKPEFWQDQKLSRLPALTRLVYVCLWSMADDEGRIEADAETVWHFGFPREKPEDIKKALGVLAESSRIVLYRGVNGAECIAIPRWAAHQRIDKPSRSKIEAPPAISGDSANPPRAFAEDSTTDRDQGSGIREGIKDQGSISSPSGDTPSAPKRKTDPLILDLKNRLGSGVKVCGDQIRALRGAGWDDARIAQAISDFAEPGMAPWEWTKKARGVVAPVHGFKTMSDRADDIVRSILGGGV